VGCCDICKSTCADDEGGEGNIFVLSLSAGLDKFKSNISRSFKQTTDASKIIVEY
jgi:hypothetical protein